MAVVCSRCGAEAGDGARFCSECGAALDGIRQRERKLATIAFADLVGSSELVEGRDPEDVRRMLDPFFELARSTFEEYGGRVEKFIGDAAVAVFGVPQVHGDDPDRAVAASLLLVERLPELSDRLELRIGIESGEVLAEPGRADLAVTGEATTAAARLQQAARPGEVLVGKRAAAGCRRAMLSPPREIRAKGFGEPLVARAATGVATAGEPVDTPFLGRGEELERLRLAYLRTQRERLPTLALIVGEAGMGKTRLARELLRSVSGLSPAPEVLIGRNPPYGDGIAFWALGEILREAARVGSEANSREIHDGLESRLTEVEPARRAEVAATLVAAATGEGGEASTTTAALRVAWRRLLTSVASEGPVVVAIDDAHWADEEFLELLEDSAATLNGYPLLFICTARPGLLAKRPAFAEDGLRVELGPLADEAAVELAAALMGGRDPDLAREVAATSGGNPFFAEEIAHSVAAGDGGARMPDSVQTAIASRLDALPSGDKQVLQHAAVLGERFRAGTLAALLDRDPRSELTGLASRSLIHERADEESGLFAFHHQLIRDVAYESLPRSDRARLHERAARGIEPQSVERHPELAEVIAFHLTQAAELEPGAGKAAAAYEAARRASQYALRRAAAPRAQELLQQAARIAPDPEDRIGALSDAAEIAALRVRGEQAFGLLRAAGEAAEEAGLSELAARKYALAVEFATRSGGITGYMPEAEVVALLDRAKDLAPDPIPAELRAQILLDEAWMAFRFGRESEMGDPARAGLDLTRGIGDVRLLSSALDAVGATSHNEGRFREAVASDRERLEVLATVPDTGIFVYERHDAGLMLSEGLTRIGDLRGALETEVAAAEELLVHAPHRAYARALQALLHLGDWDRAVEYGMSVRTNWVEQGRPAFAPLAGDVAAIGFIHGARDDDVAARDWFAFAEEMAAGRPPLCGVRLFEADLALYLGDPTRALERVDSVPPDFWWSDQLRTKRAEILAALGTADAAEMVAAGPPTEDDPLLVASLLRARALLSGEAEPLHEACALLDEHEYVFEAARTRWLLGGPERASATPVLERLGAVPPGDLGPG